jgi:hypothetical protein
MSIVYNKSGDVIEITVRDATMRKVGTWKFNTADRELGEGIFRHLQSKYGFTPTIRPSENIPKPTEKKGFIKSWLDNVPEKMEW